MATQQRRSTVWAGWRLLAVVFLAGVAGPAATIPAPELPEAQVKAAFLFNFSKFVEWPAEAFPGSRGAFVICVLGSNGFADTLEEVTKGKAVNGRSISVVRLQSEADMKPCQMVFIPAEARSRIGRVLEAVKDTHILTVSEVEGFAQAGGMINIVLRADKLRFEINPEAAARAGLRVSAKLLSLATVVHRESD